ncbi:MAG: divalent metal cation transporter [Cellulomonas sp.]|uniref:NRAMP family divalent metal transporter n=1 Tax=Cellulomonas sp. 73-92 TaxID=1895740 RepID=UPI000A4AF4EE|nr:divalent metal cation transporter [Cellulomonas sp. 73-92]MBN9375773.1 divalent metal cation transporter [Cellulomonas sp.]
MGVLLGPGLMVMLADTDAGSLITAAQSGARYGYQLILAQIVLIPVLYLVQEITARLGLLTGRGHGALIRRTFGARWALLSAGTLFLACLGALVTEFAGLAGIGAMVGVPRLVSITVPAMALAALILLGRYRRIETVGIAIGALELLFIPAALLARPAPSALWGGLTHPVQANSQFLMLLAANVGAVIMPWMVFYQQEAIIDKDDHDKDLRTVLRSARWNTALGAVATQAVMIAVLVAVAATIGTTRPGANLESIGQIAAALTPFLGQRSAAVLFGLGMLGAATVAALVVSLAGAWGMAEVLDLRHSLNDSPRQAKGFYALALAAILAGALVALLAPNLVALSLDVEVMNAILLPVVLGFLLLLERRALPGEYRMRGARQVTTYALTGLVIVLGLTTAVEALLP